ncbi:MAG: ATP-binding protein [Verrucomicrobia bacterium]|nr:ATP-binding protein [Leptolyngbya sp. ES-bin-22]
MAANSDVLDEIFNALEPYKPLEANNPAYVDCDAVRGDGDILDDLGNRIRKSRQTTYQLYSGHRGAGKSTELLRLKGSLETEGCFVVYFSAIEEDVNSGDIEYTDILLACTSHLLANLNETANATPLQKWLEERWDELKDLAQTKVTLDGLSVKVAVEKFAELTANLRTEPTLRSRIREKINPHTPTLIKALNEFIQDAKTKLPEGKTKLVLIVDNLDRIAPIYDERSGRSNHEEIFIDRSEQLKALDCHIIYTIPFAILFSKWANDLNQNYNDSKILPMIMVRSPNGEIHAPGVATIREILAQRIKPFAADLDLDTEIFESAATLERLCLMSGGHVRGLLRLAQEAVNRTDTLPISAKAVQRAITEERDSYRRAVEEHQWDLLAAVSRDKKIQHDPQHRSLLFSLCLLEYSYLDEQDEKQTWHDVHPLIENIPQFKERRS